MTKKTTKGDKPAERAPRKSNPTQLDRIEQELEQVRTLAYQTRTNSRANTVILNRLAADLSLLKSGADTKEPGSKPYLVALLEREIDSFINMPGGTKWFMGRIPKEITQRNQRFCDSIVEYVTGLEVAKVPPPQEEQGLEPGDYTEASKEVADALTAMGWEWDDKDRYDHSHILVGWYGLGSMRNTGKPSDANHTHHPPADFLSRARVTAKRLGLVPKEEQPREEWRPEVHDWVVWNCKPERSVTHPPVGPHQVTELDGGQMKIDRKDGLGIGWYWVPDFRPATAEEIAVHGAKLKAKEEADKLSKLKFGTPITYQGEKAFYIGLYSTCHRIMVEGYYKPHVSANLSDITIL